MEKLKILAEMLTGMLGLGGGATIAFGTAAFPAQAAQFVFIGVVAVFLALAALFVMLCWPGGELSEQEPPTAGQWFIDHEPGKT